MNLKIISAIHLNPSLLHFILIVIVTLILINIIQHLTKKKNKNEQELFDNWHDDPANWKLGLFYFNPKDKRIFPPKRIKGLGWTINFANPFSFLGLIGIIILVLIVVGIIKINLR